MSRTSRTIGAVALLALIGAAASPGRFSPRRLRARRLAGVEPAGPGRAARRAAPAHREPRLELSDRGQPIVWLRRGAQIPIRSAPGRQGGQDVRWRTPFDSRTVLSVFRRVGQLGRRPHAAASHRPARLGEARPVEAPRGLDAATRSTSTSPARPPSFAAASGCCARSRSRWGRPAPAPRPGGSRSPTPSAATSTRPTGAARSPPPRASPTCPPAGSAATGSRSTAPAGRSASPPRTAACGPRTEDVSALVDRVQLGVAGGHPPAASRGRVCSASAASRSPRDLVDVGEQVAVAGEPEEDAAVVADDADRERVALRRERHERVDLEHAAGPAGRRASAGPGTFETTRFQVSGRAIASASTRLIVGGVQPVASITSEAARACSDCFSRVRLRVDRARAARAGSGSPSGSGDHQRRDPVAELELLVGAADAHRHQRDELLGQRLAAALEAAAAAPPAAIDEDHVVDGRAASRRARRFSRRQLGAGEADPAVAADLRVEEGAAAALGPPAARLANPSAVRITRRRGVARHRQRAARRLAGGAQRRADPLGGGADEEHLRARLVGVPALLGRSRSRSPRGSGRA